MAQDLTHADRDAILADLRAGRKIQAIKTYREATGAGLAEAKAAVEAMEDGRLPQSADAPAANRESARVDDVVRAHLAAGNKIEAIKAYREANGCGLKEAKDAVEAIEAGRGGLGGVASKRGGCLPMIGLLVAGVVVLARLWGHL